MYKQQILKQTNLFNSLDDEELQIISQSAVQVEYPKGSIIIHQGDIGHEMFVILNGTVEVFTISEGKEVMLSTWQKGHYFGEQAILPEGTNRRNATVRAQTDVSVLRIMKHDFQRVLTQDNPLKERLFEIGSEQLKRITIRQSALFRSLPLADMSDSLYEEVSFKDKEIIFKEGDPGDCLYFIVSGSVAIFREESGSQKLLVSLTKGQCFGELALIERDPRAASAVAQGKVEALKIDGTQFMTLYERTPDLREYMQTLQRVYPFAGRGFVTQHGGKFLDMESITTLYHLLDGSSIVVSNVIGQNIFNLSLNTQEEIKSEPLKFEDQSQNIERELLVSENRIVGLTVRGPWAELGLVHKMVLDNITLTPKQITAFKQSGTLELREEPDIENDTQVICQCLQIKRGILRTAVENGANTVEALSETTGTGTVCGSCIIHLQEMVEEGIWIPVTISKSIRVGDNIRSFRFIPPFDTEFEPAKPGQHIVVQAKINRHWVNRPYTLTSPANETKYYEITVKREPQGFFSNWLFDSRHDRSLVRVSNPQGRYYVDFAEPNSIVYLVAGIGMTPALATARSMITTGVGQNLHIDYTVSSWKDFAYADELRNIAAENENITLNLRVTKETGRINLADIQEMVKTYPNAEFYICGPSGYKNAVQHYLTQSRVHAGRINVEEFTPVGREQDEDFTLPAIGIKALFADRYYILIGLLLFLAFVIQDLFQLKIPALEVLQAGETYKRWSGLLLTLFIAYQWYLPILRLLGYTKEKFTVRQYHLHKQIGVLAPLIFFIHSTKFGYAYLFMLSIVYFANTLLGLLNKDILSDPKRKEKYLFPWMIGHVGLSFMMIGLIIYHIFIVFYYQ